MKRMVSLFLTAALAAGLALPAAAAEDTADARLAQVTQAVKDTLDLDTSQYDTFYGDCFDQVQASQWSLYWEGSTGSLSIDALEDGTILWYDLNVEESYSGPRPFWTRCSGRAWRAWSWESRMAERPWGRATVPSPAICSFTASPRR